MERRGCGNHVRQNVGNRVSSFAAHALASVATRTGRAGRVRPSCDGASRGCFGVFSLIRRCIEGGCDIERSGLDLSAGPFGDHDLDALMGLVEQDWQCETSENTALEPGQRLLERDLPRFQGGDDLLQFLQGLFEGERFVISGFSEEKEPSQPAV